MQPFVVFFVTIVEVLPAGLSCRALLLERGGRLLTGVCGTLLHQPAQNLLLQAFPTQLCTWQPKQLLGNWPCWKAVLVFLAS